MARCRECSEDQAGTRGIAMTIGELVEQLGGKLAQGSAELTIDGREFAGERAAD